MSLPVNAGQCLGCGDVLESRHRHDFVECSCGGLFLDGGLDYQRVGWMPGVEHVIFASREELAAAREVAS